jgi:hypothetical protein
VQKRRSYLVIFRFLVTLVLLFIGLLGVFVLVLVFLLRFLFAFLTLYPLLLLVFFLYFLDLNVKLFLLLTSCSCCGFICIRLAEATV